MWAIHSGTYCAANKVTKALDTDKLKEFIELSGVEIDFPMFNEWPISVWYNRCYPQMNVLKQAQSD